MEAEKINAEQGMENALGYLEELSQSTDASMTTQINLVQALLRSGNPEAALEKAQSLYDARPDDPSMMSLLAATETANGNFEAARSLYKKVLEQDARQPTIWSQLSMLSMREGDPETAEEIIDEALRLMPNEARLLWVKATYEERKNNIDEAIIIYEKLYSTLPDSPIIANNLASMLGTYRQDELSLQRAWTIARRFVDTKIPAIQDTYGWILHRRGLSEEALPYLEAAAEGLPSDPIVQFHLAQIYLTLGVPDKALTQFKAAVEIAGEIDQRRQIQEARAQINTLSTTLEN
jgi:Flp pilus assembly protein TadD